MQLASGADYLQDDELRISTRRVRTLYGLLTTGAKLYGDYAIITFWLLLRSAPIASINRTVHALGRTVAQHRTRMTSVFSSRSGADQQL